MEGFISHLAGQGFKVKEPAAKYTKKGKKKTQYERNNVFADNARVFTNNL